MVHLKAAPALEEAIPANLPPTACASQLKYEKPRDAALGFSFFLPAAELVFEFWDLDMPRAETWSYALLRAMAQAHYLAHYSRVGSKLKCPI
jgi:hypothetical protein